MKIYRANKKGFFKYILFAFVVLPIVVFMFDKNALVDNPVILLLILIPPILMLWVYFDTFYKIENNELIYRSGFIRGRIDIRKITKVFKGKTNWVGLKPALATNGLIIRYNKFDEIYISPENNDELIAGLVAVNREISVIE